MWSRLRSTSQRAPSPAASVRALGGTTTGSATAAAGTTDNATPAPTPPPQPPREPGPEDCCQSGCERCMWDVYAADLKRYREAVAAASGGGLSPPPPPANTAATASVDAFAALEAKLEAEAAARRESRQ